MKNMRKLYWKIFIWFWVATSLTVFISAMISSQVTQHSNNDADGDAFISSISAAAIIMVDAGNREQFIQWKQYLQHHYGIKLLLLPLSTTDTDMPSTDYNQEQHSISSEFKPIMRSIENIKLDDKPFTHPPFMVSRPLITSNGEPYRLVAKLPENSFDRYKFNRGNIISRFIIAFVITGFICYLLSLYLARPIRTLQRAARRIGRGDFTTRVGEGLGKRKDEIGELAVEFDEMAARLQSLIASRQRLLQDISHELRSPLARLSVALEIARDKSPQAEKELTRISKESEKLNLLIGQILSLASLNEKVDTVSFDQFNLVAMVKSIIEDANYEAQHLPSTIKLHSPNKLIIKANRNLLRSAVENIIRNALRYTEKNQEISIKLSTQDNQVTLVVEDSGPGIPEEKLSLIFDAFYRVDDSRTEKTGGFGLGLAIVKKAIALHQGSIRAYNLKPHGLGIEIHLPIE